MNYIQVCDTYAEQLETLKYVNKGGDLLLLVNRQTKDINFNSDGTEGRFFKYADKDKKDLENYKQFEPNYTNKEFYVIPKEVEYINVYNIWNNELIESIPVKESNHNKKEPLYKIGLMSDVHYNDTDNDNDPDTHVDDGAEYSEDLINALKTFNENNVDFISCSGDISTDDERHLRNYKLCVNKYAAELPIFTCSGNHDTILKYRNHELWKEISAINPNNSYEIVYFKDYEQFYDSNTDNNYATEDSGNGTSFYIKKYYNNTFDVFIYLNVEYGWNNPNSYGTHNCRKLNQDELLIHTEINYQHDYHLYHPQTLQCLSEILEEFKDHRCFIFTHLMLPDKAGNYHKDNNYMTNEEAYYPYANYNQHADVLRGDQGDYIRKLMEDYPNNIWFCGHSHYKWNWEKYDHDINVTRTNKSYNVHLPSLSRPLPLEIYGYKNAPKDSEGAIMEVYDKYIIIKGMVMKDNTEFDPRIISQYPHDQLDDITAEMFTYNENNPYIHIENLDNNTVQLDVKLYSTGNNNDNNIYLNNGQVDSSNFGNYIPVLRFEDVKIWHDDLFNDLDPNSENYEAEKSILIDNFTYEVMEEHNIGFRDNTTDPDEWNYYFENDHIYTTYAQGIIFKISSQSRFKNLSLHIQLQGKIGFIHEGYMNKYLPIAIFKLKTNQ